MLGGCFVGQNQIIIRTLNLLGANRASLGYDYIIYGMKLILKDNKKFIDGMTSLYIDIAKYYNTSWNCVEKNIRHLVKSIWIPDNNEIIQSMFGKSTDTKRPTNKEFFAYMYDYISQYDDSDQRAIDFSCMILCPVSHQYCKAFAEYCMRCIERENE